MLALRKVDRDFWAVKAPSSILPADLIGRVASLQHPRYGLSAGKLFVILGLRHDRERGVSTLQVWG